MNVLKLLTLYFILFWLKFLLFMQLFLMIFSGIANSADPDQMASFREPSDLGLHCLHMPLCQKL